MNALNRSCILFVVVLLVTVLVPIFGCPGSSQGQRNVTDRVEALEADLAATKTDLAAAKAKLVYISVQQGSINGVNGPHLIIEGCNVHIRSGSGETEDSGGHKRLGRRNTFRGRAG